MPDSQHVLSFLGGLGSSLVGGLKAQAALREKDKSEAAQEKAAQEAWLHNTLLKSLSDPSTTIEDHNAVLRYLFENVGPKAGVKPEDLHGLMSHVMQQTGVVKEPAPIAQAAFEVGTGGQEPPPTERPMTVGDVQSRQLAQRTRLNAEAAAPTKLEELRQKGLRKSTLQTQAHLDNLSKIQARQDEKNLATYNQRLALNMKSIGHGLQFETPEDAQLEASNYARGLSDMVVQAKQQGIDLTKARQDRIRAAIAEIPVKNAQADRRIAIAQQNAATMARNATSNEERTRLTALGQQLSALKNRRDKAVSLQEQAGRITANPFAVEHERMTQNFEWNNREREVEQIDSEIKALTGEGGAVAPSSSPKSLSKSDPRIGTVMTDRSGKRWKIQSIGPDGQPVGVPAP